MSAGYSVAVKINSVDLWASSFRAFDNFGVIGGGLAVRDKIFDGGNVFARTQKKSVGDMKLSPTVKFDFY